MTSKKPTGTANLFTGVSDDELMTRLIGSRRAVKEHLAGAEQALSDMDVVIQELTGRLAKTQRALAKAEAPHLMTVAAAARYLGISRTFLYKLMAEGQLHRHSDAVGGQARLLKADLDAYMASVTNDGAVALRAS